MNRTLAFVSLVASAALVPVVLPIVLDRGAARPSVAPDAAPVAVHTALRERGEPRAQQAADDAIGVRTATHSAREVPTPPQPPVEVTPPSPATLTGRLVTRLEGRPCAARELALETASGCDAGRLVATTDATGRFTFRGALDTYRSLAVPFGDGESLAVELAAVLGPGADLDLGEVPVPEPARLRGAFVGAPQDEAFLYLLGGTPGLRGLGGSAYRGACQALGRVPTAEFSTVLGDTCAGATLLGFCAGETFLSDTLTLASATAYEDVRLAKLQGVPLDVRVVDAEGRAVAECEVEVWSTEGPLLLVRAALRRELERCSASPPHPTLFGRTDARGRAELLAPTLLGRVSISARDDRGRQGSATWTAGAPDRTVSLALREPGSLDLVAGTVRDRDGRTGIAGATVVVDDRSTTTGADGRYRLALASPVRLPVSVEVAAPGYCTARRHVTASAAIAEEGEIDIELGRSRDVSLTLVDGAGGPIALARVRVQAEAGGPPAPELAFVSDANGRVSMRGVLASALLLDIAPPGPPGAWVASSLSCALEAGAVERVCTLQRSERPLGRLTLRAVDLDDGRSYPIDELHLTRQEGEDVGVPRTYLVGPEGSTVRDLARGTYSAWVRAGERVGAHPFEFAGAAETLDVPVSLPRAIRGRVQAASPDSAQVRKVRLTHVGVPLADVGPSLVARFRMSTTAPVAADGTFAVEGLVPGPWRVEPALPLGLVGQAVADTLAGDALGVQLTAARRPYLRVEMPALAGGRVQVEMRSEEGDALEQEYLVGDLREDPYLILTPVARSVDLRIVHYDEVRTEGTVLCRRRVVLVDPCTTVRLGGDDD